MLSMHKNGSLIFWIANGTTTLENGLTVSSKTKHTLNI